MTRRRRHPQQRWCDGALSGNGAPRGDYRSREAALDPPDGLGLEEGSVLGVGDAVVVTGRRYAAGGLVVGGKRFRELHIVPVRGRFKVWMHAMPSVIVCQAQALVIGQRA